MSVSHCLILQFYTTLRLCTKMSEGNRKAEFDWSKWLLKQLERPLFDLGGNSKCAIWFGSGPCCLCLYLQYYTVQAFYQFYGRWRLDWRSPKHAFDPAFVVVIFYTWTSILSHLSIIIFFYNRYLQRHHYFSSKILGHSKWRVDNSRKTPNHSPAPPKKKNTHTETRAHDVDSIQQIAQC